MSKFRETSVSLRNTANGAYLVDVYKQEPEKEISETPSGLAYCGGRNQTYAFMTLEEAIAFAAEQYSS